MAQVSEAERWVNEYTKDTFTAGAAPDGVKTATLNLARYYMTQQLLENNHIDEMPHSLDQVLTIVRTALQQHTKDIDYSNVDLDLRNMIR